MTKSWISINGWMHPKEKAMVSVYDHGFLYGDGIYETIRVYNGILFSLPAHLKRLKNSAEQIHLKLPNSFSWLRQEIQKTVKKNKIIEGVVRITVSRGPGPLGFDAAKCKKATVVIMAHKFEPYPSWYFSKGIKAAISTIRRNSLHSLPPSAKTTNCLNGILAKEEATRFGAQEAILTTLNGEIAEGTVSNFFLVKNNILYTPKLDGQVLPGVTQDHVIKLGKKLGFKARFTRLNIQHAKSADEIFLTNTTLEIVPVRHLYLIHKNKRKMIWQKKQGVVTQKLRERFRIERGNSDRV